MSRVLSVFGVLGLAGAAQAQVNAENFASAVSGPGVGLSAAVGHTSAVGNVDLFDLREEAAAHWLTTFSGDEAPSEQLWFRDRVLLTVRGAHKGAAGEPILNETLAHLRLTHMLVPRFGVESFAQVNNDRAVLLDWRAVGGAGVRAVAFLEERGGLWGGTGYMAEYEVRNVPAGGPDDARVLNHRSTSYLSWRLVLVPDAITWVNTGYVQPRLDDWSDVQVVDESSLDLAVTEHFGVRSGLRVRYDSQPPADLVPLDLRVSTSLTFSWSAPSGSDAAEDAPESD